jgi:hypothetical protein
VQGGFRGWCLLGGERALTFVPLPEALHAQLCDATLQVVRDLPKSVGTPLELVYSKQFEEHSDLESNVVNRPDCFIAPFTRANDGVLWLNLSAVDPETPRFCGRLLAGVGDALGESVNTAPVDDRCPSVQQAARLNALRGSGHLASALSKVLLQGYKQGLETILRSMGKIDPHTAPRWLTPAAEIVGDAGQIQSIRLCWVADSRPRMRRVVEVPTAGRSRQDPRRRKARSRRLSRRGKIPKAHR